VVINGVEAMSAVAASVSKWLLGERLRGAPLLTKGWHSDGTARKDLPLYFSTKQKGSGIGLAMTFRVVQLHGGTIDFSSEPGKGTTFELRFPLAGSI